MGSTPEAMDEPAAVEHLHHVVTGSHEPPLDDVKTIALTLSHHGQTHSLSLPEGSTLTDLSSAVASDLSIPPSNQKFLLPAPHGLQRPPFKTPDLALGALALHNKPIKLLGDPTSAHDAINSALEHTANMRARRANPPIKAARPAASRPSTTRMQQDTQYTFHLIRPLPTLADPEASRALLRRLADDAGVRAAMRRHQFSGGLLTEMDPAQHTTHESRTLGLNRNRGEVIELRLRTDDDTGYRDYRTIRRTLCHELAHNVHGEHDRHFWDLYRQIEREVERDDYRTGGHSVGGQEYAPERPSADEEEHVDGGGWTGGEFRLGGGSGGLESRFGSTNTAATAGLSRREILARAAEERAMAAKRANEGADEEAKREGL